MKVIAICLCVIIGLFLLIGIDIAIYDLYHYINEDKNIINFHYACTSNQGSIYYDVDTGVLYLMDNYHYTILLNADGSPRLYSEVMYD